MNVTYLLKGISAINPLCNINIEASGSANDFVNSFFYILCDFFLIGSSI